MRDLHTQNTYQVLLSISLCFLQFVSISSQFNPTDKYLISCGSNTDTTVENRVFTPDTNSVSVHLSTNSKISINDQDPSPISSPLYQNARIFTQTSSYEFNLNSDGTLLLRLHFYPISSPRYNLSATFFNVLVQDFTLLKDFNVPNKTTVLKEFLIKVNGTKFVISFIPTSSPPLAFVNAIEVFSAPDDLVQDTTVRLLNPKGAVSEGYGGLKNQVLETVHRINVGGLKITPSNDTLWRTWIPDDEFLLSKSAAKQFSFSGRIKYQEGSPSREVAPDGVYNTAQEMNKGTSTSMPNFNITWIFPVSRGFKYLLRMHFCDIVSDALQELYFNIYVNGYMVIKDFDLSTLTTQSLATPYYVDLIVYPVDPGLIPVSVGPSDRSQPSRRNAILNGLEILKINGELGPITNKKPKKYLGAIVGSVLGGLAFVCLIAVLLLLVCKQRKRMRSKPKTETKPTNSAVWLPGYRGSSHGGSTETTRASLGPNLNLRLMISFADIKLATGNFAETSLIGSGGFGNVYKGVLKDGTKIAVKRAMPGSRQGLSEFLTEIAVLSKIRHRHLVSLIGYCEENSEMILVYEYMENGTLRSHLYGSNLRSLSWKQRLLICIGSARGLHYLHTGSSEAIIHRDVKSANILLDENFMAKVADFGLSKAITCLDQSHVSTNVKGSFGYLDPEYFRRQHLTDKSDVYSFGVVLLEVLCARPAIDIALPREQVNLAEWGLMYQKKGMLEKIIDPTLTGKINESSLRKFGETVENCLAEYGVDRPTMGDILWNLEYALQLQESQMKREPYEDSTVSVSTAHLPLFCRAPSDISRVESESIKAKADSGSDTTASQIFSQLISTEGR